MSYKFDALKEISVSESDMIYDVQFHPTKSNILTISTIEGDVHVLDINAESCKPITSLTRRHKGLPIRRLRFVDENLLVTAAKTIKLTDLNTGKVTRTIKNDGAKIYSLIIIDNFLLGIGDDEGNFKVWDFRIDQGAHMEMKQCEDYISDLHIDSGKRIVVASSGEGTLSAFNIRAKRMEEPQSELFDAGFQSVRYMEGKEKVIVGAEDSAINIFNIGEWGNISDRFVIKGTSTRGEGACSIDNIEIVNEDHVVAGSSDGKLRFVSILPNKVLCEICSHSNPIECVAVNVQDSFIVSTNDNLLNIFKYAEVEKGNSSGAKPNFFEDML